MRIPDRHKQRLEALRKQAVERLRDRRVYRCPNCGNRSFQRGRASVTLMKFERTDAGCREFRVEPREGFYPLLVSDHPYRTAPHSILYVLLSHTPDALISPPTGAP